MARTKTKEPFDQVIFISDVHFGKGNIEKLQIIKDYFYNFGYEVKEDLIKNAFNERFSSSTSDDNATYKVEEIYDGDELDKIKTTIFLNLKQD